MKNDDDDEDDDDDDKHQCKKKAAVSLLPLLSYIAPIVANKQANKYRQRPADRPTATMMARWDVAAMLTTARIDYKNQKPHSYQIVWFVFSSFFHFNEIKTPSNISFLFFYTRPFVCGPEWMGEMALHTFANIFCIHPVLILMLLASLLPLLLLLNNYTVSRMCNNYI